MARCAAICRSNATMKDACPYVFKGKAATRLRGDGGDAGYGLENVYCGVLGRT